MECSAFPVTAPSPSLPELPGSSAQPLSCPASAGIEAAPLEQRSEPGPEQLQGWEGALCPLPVAFGAQVSPEQPRSNPGATPGDQRPRVLEMIPLWTDNPSPHGHGKDARQPGQGTLMK